MRSRVARRSARAALAAAALVALWMPAAPAGAGSYGGGGGGGGGTQKEDLPANVSVRVKGGDLVMKGSVGTVLVRIVATATGLRIQGRGDTKVNGKDAAFETDDVTGDWKLKFPRSRASEVTVEAENESALVPRVGKLVFVGGLRSKLRIANVEILGDVKVSMNRSLVDKSALTQIEDSTIGGDLKVSASSMFAALILNRCRIGGRANLTGRTPRGLGGRRSTIYLTVRGSEVGAIALRHQVVGAVAEISSSTVHGDCSLIGDNLVDISSCHIGGDLTMKANTGEQIIAIAHSVVEGTTTVVTGKSDDRLEATDCTFGVLDVRTGAGNDTLVTTRTTAAPGSRYRASRGKRDVWTTTDESLVVATGVETIEIVASE